MIRFILCTLAVMVVLTLGQVQWPDTGPGPVYFYFLGGIMIGFIFRGET